MSIDVDFALSLASYQEREVLTALYLEGLSVQEVAAEYSCSVHRIQSLAKRGLRRIRRGLVTAEIKDLYGLPPLPPTPPPPSRTYGARLKRWKKSVEAYGLHRQTCSA